MDAKGMFNLLFKVTYFCMHVPIILDIIMYTWHAHFRYTNRINEQVWDLLLEQLAEKYPEESTPVLKREFARLKASLCVNVI